jgi:hypothetical protein
MTWQTDEPRCKTCRWWYCAGDPSGECRRYPPNPPQFVPSPHGHGLDWHVASWPHTQPHDFCGEHQPAKP